MKHKGIRTLKWAKDKLDEGSQKVMHIVRSRSHRTPSEDEQKASN
jgi:hypothetical protein